MWWLTQTLVASTRPQVMPWLQWIARGLGHPDHLRGTANGASNGTS